MKNKTLIICLVLIIILLAIIVTILGINNANKSDTIKDDIPTSTQNIKEETTGGKEAFDILCNAVNQTYDEHTYSRISDNEIIYELNNENYYISITASKIDDKISTIRLISLNGEKSLYYSVSKIKIDGVTEEDIIDFLDGGLDGASLRTIGGVNLLINRDKNGNPILDVNIK